MTIEDYSYEFEIFELLEITVDSKRYKAVMEIVDKYYPKNKKYEYINTDNIKYAFSNRSKTVAIIPKVKSIEKLIKNETRYNKIEDKEMTNFVFIGLKYGVDSEMYKKLYKEDNMTSRLEKALGCKSLYDEFHMDFTNVFLRKFLTDLTVICAYYDCDYKIRSSDKLPTIFESDVISVACAPINEGWLDEVKL